MWKSVTIFATTFLFVLAIAESSPGQNTSTASAPAEKKLRVVAPGIYKELADSLVSNYTSTSGSIPVEFLRIESEAVAVPQVLGGADILIWPGKISDKATLPVAIKWGAIQPKCQVLGGRCVALAVHATNPLKAVTLDQAKTILSGKVNNWKALGGPDKPVRRYGTARPDAMANLVNEKLLSSGSWAPVTYRKTTSDILDVLSTDPQGFAFVDFTEASTRNNTIRILGIGPADKPVLPTAQTVKDGSYPLSEVLMLYTTNKTSPKGKALADFILSGDCDSLCRKMGYVPGLRAVRADVIATFDKLYGADVKKAAATPEPDDDIALAKSIIEAAKTTDLDPDLLTLMCDKAYDVVSNAAGGAPIAMAAMQVLEEKLAERRFHCSERVADLLERAHVADKKPESAEMFLAAALNSMDLGTKEGQHAYVLELGRKALTVATEAKSPNLEYVKLQVGMVEARQAVLEELPGLLAKLDANSNDNASRSRVIWINLVDCDNPAEAARYLDTGSKDEMLTNIPMVMTPAEKLSEEAAFALAEWYLGLADKAGPAGRDLMFRRSQGYYQQYFNLHKGKDKDSLTGRATLGLKKAEANLASYDPPAAMAKQLAAISKPVFNGQDILPKLEMETAVASGKCERTDSGILITDQNNPVTINLPVAACESCEVTMTATIKKAGYIGVSFPVTAGKHADLFLNLTGRIAYIGTNDKDQTKSTGTVPLAVGQDKEYDFRFKLAQKNGKIEATIAVDDKAVLSWSGTKEQLADFYQFFSNVHGENVGLLSQSGEIVITHIVVNTGK